MDKSLGARHIKERINKWDLIKIKSFCMAKESNLQELTDSHSHSPVLLGKADKKIQSKCKRFWETN